MNRASEYNKSSIINLIRNNPNYIQESFDFPEAFDQKFILNSEICTHCKGEPFEIISLRNENFEYILYSNYSNIECFAFSYKKLKKLFKTFMNCDEIYYIRDDNTLTETIWEIIEEIEYDGKSIYELDKPIQQLKMKPWMRDFLSQIDETQSYWIHDENETKCNFPFITNLILAYGWEDVKKILDLCEKVNDNPLVRKLWVTNHPLSFVPKNEKFEIWKKYFSLKFEYAIL